jgi:hypothetical protein
MSHKKAQRDNSHKKAHKAQKKNSEKFSVLYVPFCG